MSLQIGSPCDFIVGIMAFFHMTSQISTQHLWHHSWHHYQWHYEAAFLSRDFKYLCLLWHHSWHCHSWHHSWMIIISLIKNIISWLCFLVTSQISASMTSHIDTSCDITAGIDINDITICLSFLMTSLIGALYLWHHSRHHTVMNDSKDFVLWHHLLPHTCDITVCFIISLTFLVYLWLHSCQSNHSAWWHHRLLGFFSDLWHHRRPFLLLHDITLLAFPDLWHHSPKT